MKLPLKLKTQIPEADWEEFQDSYRNCRYVRKELVRYFESMLHQLVKEDEKLTNYDSPNCLALHADNLGERRALRKIIDVLRAGETHGWEEEKG